MASFVKLKGVKKKVVKRISRRERRIFIEAPKSSELDTTRISRSFAKRKIIF